MGYKFTAQWLKGANNEAADALSYQQPADGDDLAEHEIDTHHSQAAVYGAPSIAQLRSSTLPPSEEDNLQLRRRCSVGPLHSLQWVRQWGVLVGESLSNDRLKGFIVLVLVCMLPELLSDRLWLSTTYPYQSSSNHAQPPP